MDESFELKSSLDMLRETISDKLSRWFDKGESAEDATNISVSVDSPNQTLESTISKIITAAKSLAGNNEIQSLKNELMQNVSESLSEESQQTISSMVDETVNAVRFTNNPLMKSIIKNKLINKMLAIQSNAVAANQATINEIQNVIEEIQDFQPGNIETVEQEFSVEHSIMSPLIDQHKEMMSVSKQGSVQTQDLIQNLKQETVNGKVEPKNNGSVRNMTKQLTEKVQQEQQNSGISNTSAYTPYMSSSISPSYSSSSSPHASIPRSSVRSSQPAVQIVHAHSSFSHASAFNGASELS